MPSPKELKFKMEPTCIINEQQEPSRLDWPPHIDPWWKPADRFEKPPYSYATLIAHALLSSQEGRLTLSEIYTWISETYPYFQPGEKSWQNSVRHNLSMYRDWFRRVDRRPTLAQPGKGGYWQVEMHMEKIFIDNLCQVGGYGRKLPSMRIGSRAAGGESVFRLKEKFTHILVVRPEDFKTVKKSLRMKKERPSVKKGKKRDGSHSTKSKATIVDGTRPTVVPQSNDHCLTEPSLSELFMYDESLFFNDYTYLTNDSNNEEPATRVIDLQSLSMEKNIHFSTNFSIDAFTDPTSKLFIPGFDSYQINQYVDPSLTINQLDQDACCSDHLLDIDFLEFL